MRSDFLLESITSRTTMNTGILRFVGWRCCCFSWGKQHVWWLPRAAECLGHDRCVNTGNRCVMLAVKWTIYIFCCHLRTLSAVAMRQASDKEIPWRAVWQKSTCSCKNTAYLVGRIVIWDTVQLVICLFLQLSESIPLFWCFDPGQQLSTTQPLVHSPYPN